MQDTSKRGHHTGLVLRMADRQNIDLAELVMRAEFSFDDLDQAVDKCLGCTQPGACASFLESDAAAGAIPNYCQNGDVFRALKAQ